MQRFGGISDYSLVFSGTRSGDGGCDERFECMNSLILLSDLLVTIQLQLILKVKG